MFSAYQKACAAAPFKASVAGSGWGDTDATNTNAQPRNTPRDQGQTRTFPPTINNIEPREARPLLRRILEPDPKFRVTSVQEILDTNTWVTEIEVCTELKKPRHQHTNIRAALGRPVVPLGGREID
jgi:serine/threonine protein kinase